MKITNNTLIDYDDILIEPALYSDLSSRSEASVTKKKLLPVGELLPLMTAPMDSVINDTNMNDFLVNGIVPVLPRNCNPRYRHDSIFISVSLEDIIKFNSEDFDPINNKNDIYPHSFLCVDIANGHMSILHNEILKFKNKYPNVFVMTGNIANPNTLKLMVRAKVDAVRLGIGNGNLCLTTEHTAVGYPMASLISECRRIVDENGYKILLVADGGTKSYSDIIKALALGADYVMIGSLFSKFIDSAGDTYLFKKIKIKNKKLINFLFKWKFPLYKMAYGMSTKIAQKKWGRKVLKTSVGVVRFYPIKENIYSWKRNFVDYLSSAMSYCNCTDINNFYKKVNINTISVNALKRFNK
jgi:GMP reductase